MDNLGLKIFVLGDLGTNCYLIFDTTTKNAFIIDPAVYSPEITHFIRKRKLNLEFVLLTHGHFDHIGGVDELGKPFYIHPEDASFLADTKFNASVWYGEDVIINSKPILFSYNKPILFDSYHIDVISTPGHTPGSVSFRLDKWLFSGDTLFRESIGRTDIPLASHHDILRSVREKLFVLDDDLSVYPGHGPATSLGFEKANNPFLR